MDNIKKLFDKISVKLILPPLLMFIIVILLAFSVGRNFFNKLVAEKASIGINEVEKNFKQFIKQETGSFLLFSEFLANNKLITESVSNNNFNNLFEIQNYLQKMRYNIKITDKEKNIIYPEYYKEDLPDILVGQAKILSKNGQSFLVTVIPIVAKGEITGYIYVEKKMKHIIKHFNLPSFENIILFNNAGNSYSFEAKVNDIGNISGKGVDELIKKGKYQNDIFHYKLLSLDNNVYAFIVYSSINEINSVKLIFRNLSVFSVFMLVFGGAFYLLGMQRVVISRINKLKETLTRLAKGEITEHIKITANDEIGEMNVAANGMIENLKNTSDFAINIGEGNYSYDYTPASDKDRLGLSLIKMRDELLETEKLKKQQERQEFQRNWAAEGRVKFADILRQNNNMQELADNIVSTLVQYLKATQAGIYLINDNDPDNKFVELISLYAYNRRKYLERKLEINEGLTGACIYEKETILLKNKNS